MKLAFKDVHAKAKVIAGNKSTFVNILNLAESMSIQNMVRYEKKKGLHKCNGSNNSKVYENYETE